MFTAAAVPVERQGDTSPLLEAAYDIGKPSSEETDHTKTSPGPATGTFEQFVATFGR